MNLHMENQRLRFRVTKDELALLCEGEDVKQWFDLPSQRQFTITICTDEQEDELLLRDSDEEIMLCVQKDAAQGLFDALPSQEGFEVEQKTGEGKKIQLVFEVDIRSQKRAEKKQKV